MLKRQGDPPRRHGRRKASKDVSSRDAEIQRALEQQRAAVEIDSVESLAPPALPGFYYDSVKERYFPGLAPPFSAFSPPSQPSHQSTPLPQPPQPSTGHSILSLIHSRERGTPMRGSSLDALIMSRLGVIDCFRLPSVLADPQGREMSITSLSFDPRLGYSVCGGGSRWVLSRKPRPEVLEVSQPATNTRQQRTELVVDSKISPEQSCLLRATLVQHCRSQSGAASIEEAEPRSCSIEWDVLSTAAASASVTGTQQSTTTSNPHSCLSLSRFSFSCDFLRARSPNLIVVSPGSLCELYGDSRVGIVELWRKQPKLHGQPAGPATAELRGVHCWTTLDGGDRVFLLARRNGAVQVLDTRVQSGSRGGRGRGESSSVVSLVGNMQSAVEHVLGLGDGRCVLASDRAGALRLFDVRRGGCPREAAGDGLQSAHRSSPPSKGSHCLELLSGRGSWLKSGPFWVTPGERAVAVTTWLPDGGLCGGQNAERGSFSVACAAASPLLEVRSLRTGALLRSLALTEAGWEKGDSPRAPRGGACSLKLCPNDVHALASGDWGWEDCWGVGSWRAGPNEGIGRDAQDVQDTALRLMKVQLVGSELS